MPTNSTSRSYLPTQLFIASINLSIFIVCFSQIGSFVPGSLLKTGKTKYRYQFISWVAMVECRTGTSFRLLFSFICFNTQEYLIVNNHCHISLIFLVQWKSCNATEVLSSRTMYTYNFIPFRRNLRPQNVDLRRNWSRNRQQTKTWMSRAWQICNWQLN